MNQRRWGWGWGGWVYPEEEEEITTQQLLVRRVYTVKEYGGRNGILAALQVQRPYVSPYVFVRGSHTFCKVRIFTF